ncbi:MAG: 6-bladed beta-propeller, partial [Cytophagales bacterium]
LRLYQDSLILMEKISMKKRLLLIGTISVYILLTTIKCFAQKVEQFDNVFQEKKRIIIHQDNGLSGVFGEFACSEKGEIIIVDISSKKVVVFDSSGRKLMNIGREGKGPGEYLQPVGLCLDSKGNIFVSDNNGRKLIKYNKNGKYESFFYFGLDHWIPSKMAIYDSLLISFGPKFQPPSPFLYENIEIYSVKNGRFIRSFFRTSENLLEKRTPLVLPVGLVSEKGEIFVCLNKEYLIYVFDLEGRLLEKFGEKPDYFKEFEGFKSEAEAVEFLEKPSSEQKETFYKNSKIDNMVKHKDYLITSTECHESVSGKKERVYYIDVIDLKSKKKVSGSLRTKYRLVCMNKENFVFILSENEYENGTALEIGYFKFSIKEKK